MLFHSTYKHTSSDQWVTFVHGAGGSSTIWYKQLREFKKHFNLLLVDLRGHGRSKNVVLKPLKRYTFESVTADIVEVLDHLNIEKTHLIGISLGTILIREMAMLHPERVSSMIMGGAIMKLNTKAQILMRIGVVFKSVLPYIILYKFFAFIIMPAKNHKESRLLFVGEAKKLAQKEFLRWYKLTADINPLLRLFRVKEIRIPTFYIMGEEDHLFLPSIQKIVKQHVLSSLFVIPSCGHVVNVEQPAIFNREVISYISEQAIK